ncbi:hypothetical protein JCM1840_003889 [Sporobolomyces johnsonii]
MSITYTQPCTFNLSPTNSLLGHDNNWYRRYLAVPITCSTLPGNFSLRVNADKTAYTLSWTAVKHPLEIVGGCVSLSSNGAALASVDIWAGKFPSSSAGGLEIPFTTFQTSLDLAISLETGTKQNEQAKDNQTLAARSAAIVVHRSPNDVCFEFPRTSQQLWSNEDNLRKLSTYYASLLSSDFAEGSTSSQLVPISSSLDDYTYEDSDAETDGLEVGSKVKSKKSEKPAQPEDQDQDKEVDGAPFKRITVVDTAYTTYFAVLVWIATGYIRFAPLRSKFMSDAKGAEQARAAEIDKISTHGDSQLPPPTSPKSVYRLAHLLELPELLQLALDNYKSQISAANVAYELYSDVSCSYEAIRDVALEFAVAHWKEVGEAEGTREMERRAYAEELPKAATRTSMLLARKLMVKYGGM